MRSPLLSQSGSASALALGCLFAAAFATVEGAGFFGVEHDARRSHERSLRVESEIAAVRALLGAPSLIDGDAGEAVAGHGRDGSLADLGGVMRQDDVFEEPVLDAETEGEEGDEGAVAQTTTPPITTTTATVAVETTAIDPETLVSTAAPVFAETSTTVIDNVEGENTEEEENRGGGDGDDEIEDEPVLTDDFNQEGAPGDLEVSQEELPDGGDGNGENQSAQEIDSIADIPEENSDVEKLSSDVEDNSEDDEAESSVEGESSANNLGFSFFSAIGSICVAGVIASATALYMKRRGNSGSSTTSGGTGGPYDKKTARFDSVVVDGSSNPSEWRDLDNKGTIFGSQSVGSQSVALAGVQNVPVDTKKEKGNKENLVGWIFSKDSRHDTLSQGSGIPWNIRRSFRSGPRRDTSMPNIANRADIESMDVSEEGNLRDRNDPGANKIAAVISPKEHLAGSRAQVRMQDTLRLVNNATHLQTWNKQDMHLAIIMDASSAFSEAEYQSIKSSLFNGQDGLFDCVAQEVPGRLKCSFIQYANHSSASAETEYTDMVSGKKRMLSEHAWLGRECHDREIHLALNRCLHQLRGYGRPDSVEMRRAVILSGGPVTENGSPSNAGFAALESARALHADGVPVVMIDFNFNKSKDEGIASGDPPLYFGVDSMLGFQLVIPPLSKLLGSVHLTTQTYRSSAGFQSAMG